MKRNKLAQVYIDDTYRGIIEVVRERPNFYEFVVIGHGKDVRYLIKKENVELVYLDDVDV